MPPTAGLAAGGSTGNAAAANAAGSGAAAGASGASSVAMQMVAAGVGAEVMPSATCEKGAIKAAELVFIGESFIALSGAIPRFTTDLARKAGAIGMNESYRSFAISGTQLTTGEITMQYENAKQESPVKVVLMDGAGNDLLLGNRCQTGFDASCMEIITVVDTLFKQLETDRVKDVIYFFYPDPMGIGAQIKDAMDKLRPEMQKLCEETTAVNCVWVDQRESWEGNYDEYTADGIHPTDAGAMASARQIWNAMVANCVAQ